MLLSRLQKCVLDSKRKLDFLKKFGIDKNELIVGDNFLDLTVGEYGVRFSDYFEED
ncbi:MAG: hypothetical protein H7196_03755 [candidate division SR1 bacterium]|nr:hypothetical protein [candidate division SR1 bacterium]